MNQQVTKLAIANKIDQLRDDVEAHPSIDGVLCDRIIADIDAIYANRLCRRKGGRNHGERVV